MLAQRLNLICLPVEILAEAFAYLDISGVFTVKLTCKTFYLVTKTRQFWYNHIKIFIRAHHVCPPEDELDNYTVNELEQWVLRRARALDVWTSSREPHFRKRTVGLPSQGLYTADSSDFILIPGGRWLLIRHYSAVVYYIDLECPESTPQTLFDLHEFDDQVQDPQPEFFAFTIRINKASPRLSFWLACFVMTTNISRTYTSRINMVGHGADATLVASNTSVFRNFDLKLCSGGMTLNDRYLVQVWCNKSYVGQIGIYEHGPALGCLDYPVNHDGDHHAFDVAGTGIMEFIHDDIIAIQSKKTSFLYIFEVESSSSIKLLHHVAMCTYLCSTPRRTADATVIAMMNYQRRGDIQGLVIPHDTSHPPVIVELGTHTVEPLECILGTRLLVTQEWPQQKVFRYGWDFAAPANQPSALVCIFETKLSRNFFACDEDIGRFLTLPALYKVDIFDIF